jgi:hypothetical protein
MELSKLSFSGSAEFSEGVVPATSAKPGILKSVSGI